MKSFLFLIILFLSFSCEEGKTLNERVGKISDGIKKFDSTAAKVSKTVGAFAEHAGKYMDTTKHYKDSLGQWHKKE